MPKKYLSLCLLVFLFCSFTGHKFYVSHYRIDYKTSSLQVTAKIFTDDLEKAISTGSKKYRINEQEQADTLNRVLFDYVKGHFRLKADGEMKALQWVGFETEADITWIYFEIPGLKKAPSSLHIFCSSLTEIYDEQVNLFNIGVNDAKKTFFLNENDQNMELSFP